MTFNTGNPVPSVDARDLSDNAENMDSAVNELTPTWVDRINQSRRTLQGQIDQLGFDVPVVYAASIVFTTADRTKTVDEGGVIYAPLPSALPFTTSGTWSGDDDSRFYVVQGLKKDDVGDYTDWHFSTVGNAKASIPIGGIPVALKVGDVVTIRDRESALFDVVLTSGVTPNDMNIIQSTAQPTLSLSLQLTRFHVDEWGAVGDGVTDDYPVINAIATYLTVTTNLGGVILFGLKAYAIETELGDNDKTIIYTGIASNVNPGTEGTCTTINVIGNINGINVSGNRAGARKLILKGDNGALDATKALYKSRSARGGLIPAN